MVPSRPFESFWDGNSRLTCVACIAAVNTQPVSSTAHRHAFVQASNKQQYVHKGRLPRIPYCSTPEHVPSAQREWDISFVLALHQYSDFPSRAMDLYTTTTANQVFPLFRNLSAASVFLNLGDRLSYHMGTSSCSIVSTWPTCQCSGTRNKVQSPALQEVGCNRN